MKKRWILLIFALILMCPPALAHSGGTDSNGGHYVGGTGEYHYHHGYPAHQHPNGVCPYAKTSQSAGTTNKPAESATKAETSQAAGTIRIENIAALFVIAILAGCFLQIVYDCIRDCSPTKKVLYIFAILGGIGLYAGAIYLIRVHPVFIAYRKEHAEGQIIFLFFAVFAVGMTVGGLLHPHYGDPENTRERIGDFLKWVAWYSIQILVILFPIILALELD